MAELRATLGVRDLEKELKFYEALGFEVGERWEQGAVVRLDRSELTLEAFESLRVSDGPLLDWDRSQSAQLGTGVQLYLMVSNVDDMAARIPVGIPRPWPVQEKAWGLRELSLRTPSGYILTFAQPGR